MNPLNFIFSETNKTLIGDFDFSSATDFTKEYTVSRQVNINNSSLTSTLLFKRGIQNNCTVSFINSTTINLLVTTHGYLVGQKVVLNSGTFVGVSLIVSSIIDVDNFRCTVVNQSSFSNENGLVYLLIDNASYTLSTDSQNNLRHGLYTITDAITETGVGVIDTIVTIFSYCFDIPTIQIVHTVDCGTANYTVTDGTSYSVDEVSPTFVNGYQLSLLKDNNKPVVVSRTTEINTITLGYPDLYAGFYTATLKTGELSYQYSGYKVQVQFTGTSKYDVQCDKGICDIFCGINTLRKNMESAKLTNPTQYIKLRDLFVLISAYVETYYMAKKCKNETEASAILNMIKSLGGFTDNCCGGDLENYQIIAFDSCGCTDSDLINISCEPYLNSYIDSNVSINSKLEVQMNNFNIRLDIEGRNVLGVANTPYLQILPVGYCSKKKIKLSRIIIVTNDAGNKSYAGILIFNNIFGSDVVAGQGNSFNETSIIIPSIGDNTFCILENSNFNMVTGGGIVGSEIPNGGLPTVSSFTSPQGLTTDLALGDLGLDSKYGLSTGNIVLPIEGSRTVSGSTHILRTIDQTPLLFKYKNTNLAGGFNGKLTVVLEGIII